MSQIVSVADIYEAVTGCAVVSAADAARTRVSPDCAPGWTKLNTALVKAFVNAITFFPWVLLCGPAAVSWASFFARRWAIRCTGHSALRRGLADAARVLDTSTRGARETSINVTSSRRWCQRPTHLT
jgi:hypothetical protein